jgi:hypothetical protein
MHRDIELATDSEGLDNLFLKRGVTLPDHVQNSIHSRLLDSAISIEYLRRIEFNGFQCPEGFNPMNPSMIKIEPTQWKDNTIHYLANMRCVSYRIGDSGAYFNLVDQIRFRTKNIVCLLDEEFNCVAQAELESYPRTTTRVRYVEGMEDVRVSTVERLNTPHPSLLVNISWNSQDFTDYPYSQLYKSDYTIDLGEEMTITPGSYTLMLSPFMNTCEKNWVSLPGKHDEFIYSWSPFTIVKYSDHLRISRQHLYDAHLKRFRGSTNLLKISSTGTSMDDHYLTVVHEVSEKHSMRYYLHRFLLMDDNLKIIAKSLPIKFTDSRIEYTMSIAQNTDNTLIVAMGEMDSSAYLLELDMNDINNLLKSVDMSWIQQV